jgi:hypothetical protein
MVNPHMKLLQRSGVLLLIFAVLAITACASGSAIVMGTKRASIAPEQVTLYLDPPAAFEVIGLVSASSDAGLTEQSSLDYAIKELKKQAASLGANGVIVVSTNNTATAVAGGYAKTVQGKAIFVDGK